MAGFLLLAELLKKKRSKKNLSFFSCWYWASIALQPTNLKIIKSSFWVRLLFCCCCELLRVSRGQQCSSSTSLSVTLVSGSSSWHSTTRTPFHSTRFSLTNPRQTRYKHHWKSYLCFGDSAVIIILSSRDRLISVWIFLQLQHSLFHHGRVFGSHFFFLVVRRSFFVFISWHFSDILTQSYCMWKRVGRFFFDAGGIHSWRSHRFTCKNALARRNWSTYHTALWHCVSSGASQARRGVDEEMCEQFITVECTVYNK